MFKSLQYFLDKVLQNMVETKYTSRWLVYGIDLLLGTLSILLSYHSSLWVSPIQASILPSILQLIITTAFFNALFFILLKTHSGIIRYSTHRDIWRIFVAVAYSSIALIITGWIFGFKMPYYATVVMKNLTFSLVFLVAFRNISVNIFTTLTNYTLDITHRAVIFGTKDASVGIARSIFTSQDKNYKLVGFLTTDIQMKEKRILDLPVYHLNNNLEYIKVIAHVDTIIFAEKSDLHKLEEKFLQKCLELDLKIMIGQTPQDLNKLEDTESNVKPVRQVQIEDLLGREEIKISTEKIRNQIEGKVILVTGAAGSIGSEIVRQIALYNPAFVLVVDSAETPLHHLQLELEEKFRNLKFRAIIGDIRNRKRMTYIFSTYSPEIVYHAAAYKHVPLMENNPCEAIMTNVNGTRVLANHAIRYRVERFVMISTDKAVNPTNIMGASKRLAEIYVQSLAKYLTGKKHKTQFVTTRFGNVLGSNGSVIPRFREQIDYGGPITVTHPEITRYFMTIPEACRLVLEAGNIGKNGEIYVFDMGNPVKINDLAIRMIELAGLVPGKDIKIKYTGLRPGEKLYEELLNDKEITKPTTHEKILVANVRHYDFREVIQDLDELINFARNMQINETVRKMKDMVSEFKSNNSEFEELDIHLN